MPPIKGVFHSGALIIDQPISEVDLPTLNKVMQSKATGAWNLHLLTAGMELDHFVMYSSMANLIGNSRQAAYSSANGFLNGLAELRRAMGLPGLSVQWGAIADVGVVANDEKLEQFLRYTGLRGLKSSEALDLLKTALARNVTQFGVTLITSWSDWARFETRGGRSPKFTSLVAEDSTSKDNSIRDSLAAELSQMPSDQQHQLLSALIAEIIASVLKADSATIPQQRAINQLGIDSLMATEIQLLLDNNLGVNISILELLGDTSIQSLSKKALRSLLE
jgi:acyl carrier protein